MPPDCGDHRAPCWKPGQLLITDFDLFENIAGTMPAAGGVRKIARSLIRRRGVQNEGLGVPETGFQVHKRRSIHWHVVETSKLSFYYGYRILF
jgi:hypothetical protein